MTYLTAAGMGSTEYSFLTLGSGVKCLVATGIASQSSSTGLAGSLGSGVNFWIAMGTSFGTNASFGGS